MAIRTSENGAQRCLFALTTFLFLISAPEASAQTPAANTLKEMFAAITKCWRAPPDTASMEITLRFSINNKGGLIGKPAITHTKLGKDEKLNATFVSSVLESINTCLPLKITPGLGAAVAGRPLSLLFRQRGREA